LKSSIGQTPSTSSSGHECFFFVQIDYINTFYDLRCWSFVKIPFKLEVVMVMLFHFFFFFFLFSLFIVAFTNASIPNDSQTYINTRDRWRIHLYLYNSTSSCAVDITTFPSSLSLRKYLFTKYIQWAIRNAQLRLFNITGLTIRKLLYSTVPLKYSFSLSNSYLNID
jgi:hypothetical protein